MLSVAELWDTARVAGKMIRMPPDQRRAFETLELRIRAILPEEYEDSYHEVLPVSMGSAALSYLPDGQVAWNEIWGGFCDLAMAGGPPHKGRLLVAASKDEVQAEPELYTRVVHEICRGIQLVSKLHAAPAPVPGWVRVKCPDAVTASWLARAIVMENVSARAEEHWLDLPAGPWYRVAKEIKNVITAVAKTCHYWLDHTSTQKQRQVSEVFAALAAECPLIQPVVVGYGFDGSADKVAKARLAERIHAATGLRAADIDCAGWLGVHCPSVKSAIWMMRALVASNVFARREEMLLFLPVNPESDPEGSLVAGALGRVQGFARVRGLM